MRRLNSFFIACLPMKRLAPTLLALVLTLSAHGQSAGEFHSQILTSEQRYMPYPSLRESDVVWSTMIWKTIDVNELFNQFFYYPIDNPDPSGKKSLAYTLWDAMAEGLIPIYEDDALTIPIDVEIFIRSYTKADTILLEIGYSDDDNEEYQTIVRPHNFDGAEIYQYALREAWFIGKQESRQDSRRIALAPLKKSYRKFANTEEEIYLGLLPIFWVPLQHTLPHVNSCRAAPPTQTPTTWWASRRGTGSSSTSTTTPTSPAKATAICVPSPSI